MKHIAIAGVTGFVGRGLAAMCRDHGIDVTGISRGGSGDVDGVRHWQTPDALDFRGLDAVINLAGEPVDQRWTDERKRRFETSRVDFTRTVVAALARCAEHERPRALVNASAVGYYANRGDEELDESSKRGDGFLAELCDRWEHSAMGAETPDVHVSTLRIGLVLGRDGRAWQKLHRLFRLGLGGRLGDGSQWMPWIHVHDLRRALLHAAENSSLHGPVNAAAPVPVRNAEFTRQLAAALHRPALFPAPRFALRLVLGEFASVLLASQRVVPRALQESGFTFCFPTLTSALEELIHPAPSRHSDQH